MNGFSVRLFLPTGEPEGLRIVEKSNWTGQGIVFPRARFSEARARPELSRVGVYVIWGAIESELRPRVYVGEGDGVLPRLVDHARAKDFWTHAAVFTSKDGNLNKAHVQYMEARLVQRASAANRCQLENGNTPQPPSLAEAEIADADGFLNDLLVCLPVIGCAFFESPRIAVQPSVDLHLLGKAASARGMDTAEGFLVRADSRANATEAPSTHEFLRSIRSELLNAGILKREGDYLVLTQDYLFGSPSTAAGVMLGRSANGRTEWKDISGRPLREIQNEVID